MYNMNPYEAINHPNFSHARQGKGLWRDIVWIYHFDKESPSGVILVSSGQSSEVDPILRAVKHTSPLSPDER
jgi:hypothetical protein